MPDNSYFKDIKYAAKLLRLNVMPKSTIILLIVTVLICSCAPSFMGDMGYTALMAMIILQNLEQVFTMNMLSGMFASSPYAKDIMLRATRRFCFLVAIVVYLCFAAINYPISHTDNTAFFMVALVYAIYRVTSVAIYRRRFMSMLLAGICGGLAAIMVLDASEVEHGLTIISFVHSYLPTYTDIIAASVGIMAIGELLSRQLHRIFYKKPIDRNIFNSVLKRYKYRVSY